jgi:hypothetical protein
MITMSISGGQALQWWGTSVVGFIVDNEEAHWGSKKCGGTAILGLEVVDPMMS